MLHKDEILGHIHGPVQWSYADATAMNAATGFVASDVTQRKCCVKTDDNTIWMLTATTPTWVLQGVRGVSGDVSVTNAGVATVTDLTISSESAGDILYFDGTNWKRLAKDAGKYLKSGASAVSWDTPAGGGGLPKFSVSFSGNMYVGTMGFIDFVDSKTVTRVDLQLGTAPVDATFILDIHKNGTTIFTNQAHRPQITTTNTTGYTTDIDVSSIADGDRYTFIVDQVGSTTAGADLGVRVSYS